MKVQDFYQAIDRLAPFDTAASWDNAGLLLGSSDKEVKNVLLCLDVTDRELELVRANKIDLVITHHPVIFHALKALCPDDVCWQMIEAGCAVISAHTNLDKAPGGVNDTLCNVLGLQYKKCPDTVAEGFLNVGVLPKYTTPLQLARMIAEKLGAHVRYLPAEGKLRKIAVCAGAGGDLYAEAAAEGCDALITGDADYHDFLNAKEKGVCLFAAGHFETENMITGKLKAKLETVLPEANYFVSDREAPIKTVK